MSDFEAAILNYKCTEHFKVHAWKRQEFTEPTNHASLDQPVQVRALGKLLVTVKITKLNLCASLAGSAVALPEVEM